MTDIHNHGNRCRTGERTPPQYTPPVRKVPADSVPYGDSISRNGQTVWVAYDGERLLAVAATAEEARDVMRCNVRHAKGARKLPKNLDSKSFYALRRCFITAHKDSLRFGK